MAFATDVIGGNDLLKQVGLMAGKPGAQGGTKIKTQARIIVDDGGDSIAMPEQPRRGIGPVALGCNASVPIVIRNRRVLHLEHLEPGVFTRRLVEMTMDTDIPHGKKRYRFQSPGCRGEQLPS